jgi:hypothetical protein
LNWRTPSVSDVADPPPLSEAGKKRDAKRALTSQNTRVIMKARRMFEAEDIRRAYSFFSALRQSISHFTTKENKYEK